MEDSPYLPYESFAEKLVREIDAIADKYAAMYGYSSVCPPDLEEGGIFKDYTYKKRNKFTSGPRKNKRKSSSCTPVVKGRERPKRCPVSTRSRDMIKKKKNMDSSQHELVYGSEDCDFLSSCKSTKRLKSPVLGNAIKLANNSSKRLPQCQNGSKFDDRILSNATKEKASIDYNAVRTINSSQLSQNVYLPIPSDRSSCKAKDLSKSFTNFANSNSPENASARRISLRSSNKSSVVSSINEENPILKERALSQKIFNKSLNDHSLINPLIRVQSPKSAKKIINLSLKGKALSKSLTNFLNSYSPENASAGRTSQEGRIPPKYLRDNEQFKSSNDSCINPLKRVQLPRSAKKMITYSPKALFKSSIDFLNSNSPKNASARKISFRSSSKSSVFASVNEVNPIFKERALPQKILKKSLNDSCINLLRRVRPPRSAKKLASSLKLQERHTNVNARKSREKNVKTPPKLQEGHSNLNARKSREKNVRIGLNKDKSFSISNELFQQESASDGRTSPLVEGGLEKKSSKSEKKNRSHIDSHTVYGNNLKRFSVNSRPPKYLRDHTYEISYSGQNLVNKNDRKRMVVEKDTNALINKERYLVFEVNPKLRCRIMPEPSSNLLSLPLERSIVNKLKTIRGYDSSDKLIWECSLNNNEGEIDEMAGEFHHEKSFEQRVKLNHRFESKSLNKWIEKPLDRDKLLNSHNKRPSRDDQEISKNYKKPCYEEGEIFNIPCKVDQEISRNNKGPCDEDPEISKISRKKQKEFIKDQRTFPVNGFSRGQSVFSKDQPHYEESRCLLKSKDSFSKERRLSTDKMKLHKNNEFVEDMEGFSDRQYHKGKKPYSSFQRMVENRKNISGETKEFLIEEFCTKKIAVRQSFEEFIKDQERLLASRRHSTGNKEFLKNRRHFEENEAIFRDKEKLKNQELNKDQGKFFEKGELLNGSKKAKIIEDHEHSKGQGNFPKNQRSSEEVELDKNHVRFIRNPEAFSQLKYVKDIFPPSHFKKVLKAFYADTENKFSVLDLSNMFLNSKSPPHTDCYKNDYSSEQFHKGQDRWRAYKQVSEGNKISLKNQRHFEENDTIFRDKEKLKNQELNKDQGGNLEQGELSNEEDIFSDEESYRRKQTGFSKDRGNFPENQRSVEESGLNESQGRSIKYQKALAELEEIKKDYPSHIYEGILKLFYADTENKFSVYELFDEYIISYEQSSTSTDSGFNKKDFSRTRKPMENLENQELNKVQGRFFEKGELLNGSKKTKIIEDHEHARGQGNFPKNQRSSEEVELDKNHVRFIRNPEAFAQLKYVKNIFLPSHFKKLLKEFYADTQGKFSVRELSSMCLNSNGPPYGDCDNIDYSSEQSQGRSIENEEESVDLEDIRKGLPSHIYEGVLKMYNADTEKIFTVKEHLHHYVMSWDSEFNKKDCSRTRESKEIDKKGARQRKLDAYFSAIEKRETPIEKKAAAIDFVSLCEKAGDSNTYKLINGISSDEDSEPDEKRGPEMLAKARSNPDFF